MTVFTTAGTVPNTFGNFARVLNPHGTDVIDKLQVMLSNPATPLCPTCLGNPVGLDNIVVDPVLGAAGGICVRFKHKAHRGRSDGGNELLGR